MKRFDEYLEMAIGELYEEYEVNVDDPKGHKMASMQKVINILKESDLYKKFNEDSEITELLKNHKIEGVNKLHLNAENPDNIYLSVDLAKANFQMLKIYDESNFLTETWEGFLSKHGINSIFHLSKPFRQHVFGHLNPNRTQRHQAIIIDELSTKITYFYGQEFELIFKTYDELIYKIPKYLLIDNNLSKYIFTQNVFQLEKIGKEKYIKKYLNETGDVIKSEFKGVEGNMFYMYLRKYMGSEGKPSRASFDSSTGKFITKYNDKDLYFQENKRMAKWVNLL